MDTSIESVVNHFNAALTTFLERDIYLLEHDVYEKSLTHKLAEYLQNCFEDMNVDCEYNRNGHEPKRVFLSFEAEDEEGRFVSTYPDIIVHERGSNNHNLLIVEAKKSNDHRRNGENHDRHKLEAYARDLSYLVGIFIVFNISNPEKHLIELKRFMTIAGMGKKQFSFECRNSLNCKITEQVFR